MSGTEFKDVLSDILTGLENGTYEPFAGEGDWAKDDEDYQDMVDVIHELVDNDRYGRGVLIAAAGRIRDDSAHVTLDEIEDYLQEHYKGKGESKDALLREYAEGLVSEGLDSHSLAKLYAGLDQAGAVDWFPWGEFADSQQQPVADLLFVEIPRTVGQGDAGWYLFED